MLYKPDGTKSDKKFNKKIISESEWYYEAWSNTPMDGYYLVEIVPDGFKVRYENIGAHAGDTDKLYNGGTIVNFTVPKTGDNAPIELWKVMVGTGACGLVVAMLILRKKRKSQKNG